MGVDAKAHTRVHATLAKTQASVTVAAPSPCSKEEGLQRRALSASSTATSSTRSRFVVRHDRWTVQVSASASHRASCCSEPRGTASSDNKSKRITLDAAPGDFGDVVCDEQPLYMVRAHILNTLYIPSNGMRLLGMPCAPVRTHGS